MLWRHGKGRLEGQYPGFLLQTDTGKAAELQVPGGSTQFVHVTRKGVLRSDEGVCEGSRRDFGSRWNYRGLFDGE